MLQSLEKPRPTADTFADADEGLSASAIASKIGTESFLPGIAARAVGSVIDNPKAYTRLLMAAEKQALFVDNMASVDVAREETYDRRIKSIAAATGVTLENPERWGYQQEARRTLRQDYLASGGQGVDETGGVPAYRRRLFDQKVAELRAAHPDKLDEIPTGDTGAEARGVAKGAEEEMQAAGAGLDPVASAVTGFVGGLAGQRRDPLFVGSMFFGPTTAVGKSVIGRIASAGLRQGFFNAGIAAVEQPAVQAWRDEVGLRSGVTPALENVGMAFLFGAIPGAVIKGVGEAVRAPVTRTLRGEASAAEADTALKALGVELPEPERAAIRVAEAADEAERVTAPSVPGFPPAPEPGFVRFYHGGDDPTIGGGRWVTSDPEYARNFRRGDQPNNVSYVDIPKGDPVEVAARAWDEIDEAGGTNMVGRYQHTEIPEKWAKQLKPLGKADISESLHGDLRGAAERYADDPVNAPSPEGVAAIAEPERLPSEIADRITEAEPKTQTEAQKAASDAIEDIGNRQSMAQTRIDLEANRLPAPEPVPEGTKPAPARSKDPLDKIPLADDDGTPRLVSAREAAKAGERETHFAELVRSCK